MKKPHLIFWILSLFFLLIGFLNEIDFNKLYSGGIDTGSNMFIVSHVNLYPLIVIFLAILGIIYWISKKVNINLLDSLNLTHILLTAGGIFFLVFPRFFGRNINTIMENAMNFILIGQLIFVINLILGILKKTRKSIPNKSYN